ncbi:hypothetical protein SEVIR_6G161600v4 [Setaria viridis]
MVVTPAIRRKDILCTLSNILHFSLNFVRIISENIGCSRCCPTGHFV